MAERVEFPTIEPAHTTPTSRTQAKGIMPLSVKETITGGTIQTGQVGSRIVMTENTFSLYYQTETDARVFIGNGIISFESAGTATGSVYTLTGGGTGDWLVVNGGTDGVLVQGNTTTVGVSFSGTTISSEGFQADQDLILAAMSTTNIIAQNSFLPSADNSLDLGSSAKTWNDIYANNVRAKSATNLNLFAASGSIILNDTTTPSADNTLDLGTSSLTWNELYVNNIRAKSATNLNLFASSGSIILNDTTVGSADNTIDLGTSSVAYKVIYAYQINAPGASNLHLEADGNNITTGVSIIPDADNSHTCGASGARWSAVWAANGTIQTSSGKFKKDIIEVSQGCEKIKQLRPVSYKWKEGDDETRYGLIAEDVLAAWGETAPVYGEKTTGYGMNYAEFVPVLVKAIQELEEKLATLTEQFKGIMK